MVDDWACKKVRKKCDKKKIVEHAVFLGHTSVYIHKICNLGECEEANAQRQGYLEQSNVTAGYMVDIVYKEIRIFEIS